jgi:hypothetical protein
MSARRAVPHVFLPAIIAINFISFTHPFIALGLWMLDISVFAQPSTNTANVDLHPSGFPNADLGNLKLGVFYISTGRIVVYFDRSRASDTGLHSFEVIELDSTGGKTAKLELQADPRAVDITPGPGGGILFGRKGELDFYDGTFRIFRSVPLAPEVTGIAFDRRLNQLVINTINERISVRTAQFFDGNTLQKSGDLNYPMQSIATFGKDKLVYSVPGNCKGAARVLSLQPDWHPIDDLPACDHLVFPTDESLAYAVDGELRVIDSRKTEIFHMNIHDPHSFESPSFIGLSDKRDRIAIRTLKRKKVVSDWPYADEVYIYDLLSRRIVFSSTMDRGPFAAALAPDGHEVAILEQGALRIIHVP